MPSIVRHDDHRTNWVKARAHYARDRSLRSCSPGNRDDFPSPDPASRNAVRFDIRPKRKHSAFVLEEELKCQYEDRVGTPHLSELEPDDDVIRQLNVEALKMGSKITTLENGTGLIVRE
ncbi:hypothetical protein K505DRAFT_274812, partial [Melanomma pulvis-pyrius CBS 109.77]